MKLICVLILEVSLIIVLAYEGLEGRRLEEQRRRYLITIPRVYYLVRMNVIKGKIISLLILSVSQTKEEIIILFTLFIFIFTHLFFHLFSCLPLLPKEASFLFFSIFFKTFFLVFFHLRLVNDCSLHWSIICDVNVSQLYLIGK